MHQKLVCTFATLLLTAPAVAGDVERSPFAIIGKFCAEARRGEQLVATEGCTDCHTPPKTGPDGRVPDASRLLSGHGFAANLTPDRETGLGDWTEQNFIEAMRTGRHLGRGRPLLPPKHWPAVNQHTDAELRAIYLYLRSIPAIRNEVPRRDPRRRQRPVHAGHPARRLTESPERPDQSPAGNERVSSRSPSR